MFCNQLICFPSFQDCLLRSGRPYVGNETKEHYEDRLPLRPDHREDIGMLEKQYKGEQLNSFHELEIRATKND